MDWHGVNRVIEAVGALQQADREAAVPALAGMLDAVPRNECEGWGVDCQQTAEYECWCYIVRADGLAGADVPAYVLVLTGGYSELYTADAWTEQMDDHADDHGWREPDCLPPADASERAGVHSSGGALRAKRDAGNRRRRGTRRV